MSDVCRKANTEVVNNLNKTSASYTATSVLVVTWVKVPSKNISIHEDEVT